MMLANALLTRRVFLSALGSAAMAGGASLRAATLPLVTVHKDPSCGCCSAWARYLEQAGFPVRIIETSRINAVKQQLHVAADLASCHTAEVAGYVVEGHVPVAAIRRLLDEKPAVIGLAAPGMPQGSPGMTGTPEIFEVIAFAAGERHSFGRFRGDHQLS